MRAWAAKQTAAGPYTVADACRDYVADLRARKGDGAAREADGRLHKHLLPVLGERRLADLTTADLIGWRNDMVAEDEDDEEAIRRSRDTANRVRSIALAAFNLAFKAGRVTDDRAWRRVRPFKGVGEARKIILTDSQQQNLIDACEPGLRELRRCRARGPAPGWAGADRGPGARPRSRGGHAGRERQDRRREIHLPLTRWRCCAGWRAASGQTSIC